MVGILSRRRIENKTAARRRKPAGFFALFVSAALCLLTLAAPARVYAEDPGTPALTTARLVPPAAEFVKADRAEGVVYLLYTPPDVELLYYGAPDADKKNMTRLTVKDGDRDVLYRGETANRFELKIKLTTDLEVRMYTSVTDEELNSKGSATFNGEQYFRGRLDGAKPKIVKNTLLPTLADNAWTVAFSAEDPDDDGHYFWAKSGLRSVRIVKKYYPDSDSEPVYEAVRGLDGAELFAEFPGAGDGKPQTVRANFAFQMKNERGDYYAELTDQVGNFERVSVLNVKAENERYYETITYASRYANDENLNLTLRSAVSETLGGFLEALNEGKTGEPFNAVYYPFLKAMREANEAYEQGVRVAVTIVNGEYLSGTLDADFTAEHYGGKVLYGDTLELRLTIAVFDWARYSHPAAALLGAKRPTDVLRIGAEILFNGRAVPLAKPVKVYLTVPKSDRILALTAAVAGQSDASLSEYQAGGEWLSFELAAAGAYDIFYAAGEANLNYLWLLLLLLPLGGGIAAIAVVRRKRRNAAGNPRRSGAGDRGERSAEGTGRDGEAAGTEKSPDGFETNPASRASENSGQNGTGGRKFPGKSGRKSVTGSGKKKEFDTEKAGAQDFPGFESNNRGAEISRAEEETDSEPGADPADSSGGGFSDPRDTDKFPGAKPEPDPRESRGKPDAGKTSGAGAKKTLPGVSVPKSNRGASVKRKPKKKR